MPERPDRPDIAAPDGPMPARPDIAAPDGPMPARPDTAAPDGPMPARPDTAAPDGPMPERPDTADRITRPDPDGPMPERPDTADHITRPEPDGPMPDRAPTDPRPAPRPAGDGTLAGGLAIGGAATGLAANGLPTPAEGDFASAAPLPGDGMPIATASTDLSADGAPTRLADAAPLGAPTAAPALAGSIDLSPDDTHTAGLPGTGRPNGTHTSGLPDGTPTTGLPAGTHTGGLPGTDRPDGTHTPGLPAADLPDGDGTHTTAAHAAPGHTTTATLAASTDDDDAPAPLTASTTHDPHAPTAPATPTPDPTDPTDPPPATSRPTPALQGAALIGGLAAGTALHQARRGTLPLAAADTRALITGAPLDPQTPPTPATRLARALTDHLARWLDARTEPHRRAPDPMPLGDAPAPTLVLIRAAARTPTLLVHILPPDPTPTTLLAWAESGAAELWLIRPADRTLVRHIRLDGHWRIEETAAATGQLKSDSLPDFTLDLESLWKTLEA